MHTISYIQASQQINKFYLKYFSWFQEDTSSMELLMGVDTSSMKPRRGWEILIYLRHLKNKWVLDSRYMNVQCNFDCGLFIDLANKVSADRQIDRQTKKIPPSKLCFLVEVIIQWPCTDSKQIKCRKLLVPHWIMFLVGRLLPQ